MNVVYAGYRKWAYEIVKELLEKKNPSYSILTVLTIDNPEADFKSLPLSVITIDPKNLNSEENLKIIQNLKPDVFLFYGWSWIIPESIYTNYPCLILHTSPLPKYRGGSPLQHQIMAGEKESAATIFQATAGLDEGAIYSQTKFSLAGTISDIFDRIVQVGIVDTDKVLTGIANKTLQPTPQNDAEKTVFKRRRPEESELTVNDFTTKSAEELYNFIRALGDPYPNAFIKCKEGKKLIFKEVEIG